MWSRIKKQFASIMALALLMQMFPMSVGAAETVIISQAEQAMEEGYTPASSRTVYNMNMDWRFHKGDVTGAEAVDFDDSSWELVSVPHTFNDIDSFDEWIIHDGDANVWRGIVWYRKHFKLNEELAGQKVFIEFEGIRQAAYVYVNGQFAGRYEAGVTPFGFDITEYVQFGDTGNVIAVKNDNSAVRETGTDTSFQWNGRGFNPVYGGLTRDVKLYIMGETYFTLPLYSNLQTYGTYIYPSDISTDQRTATINIESEIRNESDREKVIRLETVIVDMEGKAVKSFMSEAHLIAAGDTQTLKMSSPMSDVKFWEPGYPYLYTVYCILKEGEAVLDIYPITTGFRKAEFLGGFNEGGVFINNKHVYLSGYAQRSTNEWALLGAATPQWIADYDGELMLESNANFVRWMHISPTPNSARMTDKYGIVAVHPAGDSESDVTGRQWEQRVEVMRDTIIYFRNHPSILFWEAGNAPISPEHMKEMRELKEQLDPYGMRAVGSRGLSAPAAVDQAEFVGTMLNRHYTDYARDHAPIIETEYTRDEAPRRVWDDYSPPDYGYNHDPASTWTYNSEEFAIISSAANFYEYYKDRIQGPASSNEMYSGQAALIWADSNQHGRNYLTETARLSGRVDALRIPKESFYAFQVMQNEEPDIHIVGHWTYPEGTIKPIYVIANHVDTVELFVNGVSMGSVSNPEVVVDEKRNRTHLTPFVFTFPDIAWEAGTIKAVGYDADNNILIETEKETTGAPYAIKLTPTTGPAGWIADGTDPVIFDVEVVDEQGRRVPTDQARIDFEYSGPGRFLGSYNSGKQYSTFKDYIDTEAGINRVIVRSTREAGEFTLTAKREGLIPATISVVSQPFEAVDGLTTERPVGKTVILPAEPPEYGPDERPPRPLKPRVLSSGKPASASSAEADKGNTANKANDGSPSSRWAAGTGSANQWWKVDLEDIYDLTGVEIDWYRGDAYYQYKIEVSTDDRNWTLVVDETENTMRQNTARHDLDIQARFVRITITAMEAGWASMYEFKVFGGGGSGGEWKSPSVNPNYDFGTVDSPLETGFVRVSDQSVYTPTWEFGFNEDDIVQSYDDETVGSDLNRDYIVGNSATFNVDLANNDYDVTIIAGDVNEAIETEIKIEGEEQAPIIAEEGQYAQKTYKVRLRDGQLNITFNGRMNAIKIMALPPEPTGLVLYAKNEYQTVIGWNPVNGAMGYKVYRAEDGSEFKLIGESSVPIYEDRIDELDTRIVSYRITAMMEMGEVTLIGESFPSAPLEVDLEGSGLEPNWQDAFYLTSDYFSEVNPLPNPPILQLVPELPQGVEPGDLIWSSDNPEVVSVDQYGIITGKQAGRATIAVQSSNGSFSAKTMVYVPVMSESFDNQMEGYTWGVRTGTAGGSGNLGGTITVESANHVLRFNGGGTGVRSSQKIFTQPVANDKVIIDFDWHVGTPANSPGGQFIIEDSAGNRYVTLQYAGGEEMIYGTGGRASNAVIEGTPIGSGFNVNNALLHIRVTFDFKQRTMDMTITNLDTPSIASHIKNIPFDPDTDYLDDIGKFQFVLVRTSGSTTSWTTWIDNFNVYHYASDSEVPDPKETAAYIVGTEQAALGQPIEFTVGVDPVDQPFNIADVVIQYDPEKLEFETMMDDNGSLYLAEHVIEPLAEQLLMLGAAIKPEIGQIRVLTAVTGENGAIVQSSPLFKVHGKVKDQGAAGETTVALLEFNVSFHGDADQVDVSQASHLFIIQLADKTALEEAIAMAQSIHDSAEEGNLPGQYPIGAKAALQAAIDSAKAVRDHIEAAQIEVDHATSMLTEAVDAFLDSVIGTPPVEGDKSVLIQVITAAEARLEKAAEGSKVGQYRVGSKAALQQEIDEAKTVRDHPWAPQAAIDQAAEQLEQALDHFLRQLISLVEGQTQISIRDLSILAQYFGISSEDLQWSEIEHADLFDEGEINIRVLAAIASMILADWFLE